MAAATNRRAVPPSGSAYGSMTTNPPGLAGFSSFTERLFQRLDEGRYRFTLDGFGIEFTIDRLRRRFDELTGELTVCCDLPGARTSGDNVLSVADFNLSSLRAREERARYLAKRAQAEEIDWAGLLEEFVQRVQRAERTGEPAVS